MNSVLAFWICLSLFGLLTCNRPSEAESAHSRADRGHGHDRTFRDRSPYHGRTKPQAYPAFPRSPKCGVMPKVKHHAGAFGNRTLTSFGQLPWQAGIFYRSDGSFMCSGTLVSSRYVLTAAFCIISVETHSSLLVRLGDWDISGRDSAFEAYDHFTVSVLSISILPSGPIIAGSENEVPVIPTLALLRLKEDIDFLTYPHIAPICLPAIPAAGRFHKNSLESQQKPNRRRNPWKTQYHKCYVSGWGLQTEDQAEEASESIPIQVPYQQDSGTESSSEEESSRSKPRGEVDNRATSPIARSLSMSPSLKAQAEPIHISIPILNDPDQAALYQTANPNPDLFNSSEVFGPSPPSQAEDSGPTTTMAPFDLPEEIDPLENVDETEPASPIVSKVNQMHTSSLSVQTENVTALPIHVKSELVSEGAPNKTEELKRENSKESADPAGDSMYRHKEKYNTAKGSSESQIDLSSEEKEILDDYYPSNSLREPVPDQDPILLNKRSDPAFMDFVRSYAGPRAYEPTFLSIRETLKWTSVTFQKNCKDFEHMDHSPLGNSCVVPTHSYTLPSLCMADLGSPITCTQDRKDAVAHMKPGKKGDPQKSRDPEGEERRRAHDPYSSYLTRSVLAGVVTWKRPCYFDDADPSVNFTVVTDVHDFLPVLLETINRKD